MATEKPADLMQSPKSSALSAQAMLRKALIKNLTSKACAGDLSLKAIKYRSVRELKVRSDFQGSEDTTPLSAKRTAETTPGSVRGKTQAPTDFPLSLNNSRLNTSLETPRRRLLLDVPRFSAFSGAQATYPLTPVQAVKQHLTQLTDYERREILEYPQVYYLGLEAHKVQGGVAAVLNYGFDDKKGDYVFVAKDHVQYRYEIVEMLGQGSFGKVCRCLDHKTKEFVALKVLRNRKRFHQQGQVERTILEQLKRQDADDKMGIVKMKSCFQWREHLCFTFELLAANLYDFMKTNDFAGLSLSLIRRFAIQLLISLRFLKANHIIHCDLKPENILLKSSTRSGIKIIDFGSACLDTEKVYSYIQSRFYRAPEVILGLQYSQAIDMWSLGCILAEMQTGFPLFPGENEQEQLVCIMEILGIPPETLISQASRRKLFFDSNNTPRIKPNSRGKRHIPGSKSLKRALLVSDSAFLDFVSRCLIWEPSERMTPDQALKHPWVQEGLRKSSREPSLQRQQTERCLRA